jgi:hypothetical protein
MSNLDFCRGTQSFNHAGLFEGPFFLILRSFSGSLQLQCLLRVFCVNCESPQYGKWSLLSSVAHVPFFAPAIVTFLWWASEIAGFWTRFPYTSVKFGGTPGVRARVDFHLSSYTCSTPLVLRGLLRPRSRQRMGFFTRVDGVVLTASPSAFAFALPISSVRVVANKTIWRPFFRFRGREAMLANSSILLVLVFSIFIFFSY